MKTADAIEQLRGRADEIARMVTSMHPLVPTLQDPPTQGEIIRALFELTKQVEVIKKQLLRLQKRDESNTL